MDFIPCLPIFVNPIAKTLFFFENQQWCTGNGPELGLRNSAFKSQILLSKTLDKPRSLPQCSYLWGSFTGKNHFFPFSLSQVSPGPDSQSEDLFWGHYWCAYCLISIRTVLCFFFPLERKNKERKKQKEREKRCQRLKGMNILCKWNPALPQPTHNGVTLQIEGKPATQIFCPDKSPPHWWVSTF